MKGDPSRTAGGYPYLSTRRDSYQTWEGKRAVRKVPVDCMQGKQAPREIN
jgi:hypothetical protein